MHPTLETFLASVNSLYQLEPKNLPKKVIHLMLAMSPEELFKTCSQLAILRHNIPSQHQTITLKEDEITRLAETYLKEMVQYLKS